MSEQATFRADAGLRALLADPAPSAVPHSRRSTARTLRLGIAAADAVQLVALGHATQAFFPGVATAFGVGETLGLGSLAAVLTVVLRRASREGGQPVLERADAEAARSAIAVALALGTTAALWWLASPRDVAAPDVLGWIAAWTFASAALAAALRHGAPRLAETAGGSWWSARQSRPRRWRRRWRRRRRRVRAGASSAA